MKSKYLKICLMFIGLALSACGSTIVEKDLKSNFIEGKWRQIHGQSNERLALNISSGTTEIYLDCAHTEHGIIRSKQSFFINSATDSRTVTFPSGFTISTDTQVNKCEITLPAGKYRADQVYGGKMNLTNIDTGQFIGVFEWGPKEELDRNDNRVIRSKLQQNSESSS